MPISRETAILRLLSMWSARVIEDEIFGVRVGLADVITPENIDRVIAFDLFPEFDLEQRLDCLAQIGREARRGQDLIRAWLAPRKGGVQ